MIPSLVFFVVPPTQTHNIYPPVKVVVFEFVIDAILDVKLVASISLECIVWRREG